MVIIWLDSHNLVHRVFIEEYVGPDYSIIFPFEKTYEFSIFYSGISN